MYGFQGNVIQRTTGIILMSHNEIGERPSAYFISPAVQTWDLRGTFQEAAAAFGQMLRHPGVQGGNAARQARLGVR